MSRLPLTPTLALLGWAAMATACFEENPSLPIDETTSTAPGTTGPGPGTTETPDPTTGQPPGTSGGSGLDSSSSGSPPPDCTEPDGNVDAACEATTPYCQGGECMGCDALGPAFCPSLGPRTPVCDLDTGTCSGCTAHDQCGTGACRIQTGECFDGDQRLWVAADRADCAQGDGSQNAPVCTITD
nr:hypothetical protein [Deltaproteobacteria bacterium]